MNKEGMFTDKEKCKCWDELSKLFYKQNFGQASKSEIELLMFHFYCNKLYEKARENKEGTDWSKCSDYTMSKQLGLTQQRISNLKVKERLAYPLDNYDWKKDFENIANKARLDRKTNNILLSVLDPNLYNEIANCIEENGGYIDITLNKKLLKINLYDYMELLYYINSDRKEEILKEYKKAFKLQIKNEDVFNENGFGAKLKKCGIEAIGSILKSLSGGILGPFVNSFIDK